MILDSCFVGDCKSVEEGRTGPSIFGLVKSHPSNCLFGPKYALNFWLILTQGD